MAGLIHSTEQQPARRRPRLQAAQILGLAAIAAVIAVLANMSVFRLLFAHPGNDQAWLLYAAGRMLHGEVLYGSRVIETNPPLIIWFSAIPVEIGRLLHLDWLMVLRVLVTAMLLGSVAWCLRILRAGGLALGTVMGWLWGLAFFVAEVSQHGNDFGQKEQLLIILLLPYMIYACLFYAAPSIELSSGANAADPARQTALAGNTGRMISGPISRPEERIALGVAAGLAICFKPQDALVLVALELFLLLWKRRWRRLIRLELITVVVTGALYAIAVELFAPLYLSQIVPLLRDTYWAFGEYTTVGVLRNRSGFNLCVLLTLVAWGILRKRLRYPAAPLALSAGSLGAALAFALQNKDWPYQFFPQQALLSCAAAWLLLEVLTQPVGRWLRASRRGKVSPGRYLLGLTLLFSAALLPAFLRVGYHHNSLVSQTPDSEFLDSVLARYPPGTPVTMLSINLMGTSDILHDHLLEGGRYHHLWMLPAIVLNERAEAGGPPARHTIPPARLRYLEELQRSNVAQDLRTRRPAVVIIPQCKPTSEEPCQGLYGQSFDILGWFLRSPDFVSAWKSYRRQSGDAFFDVYTRVPGTATGADVKTGADAGVQQR